MRFVLFMIPAVYQGAAGAAAGKDFAPSADAVEKMTKFTEELAKSGALISLDGLTPPSQGAQVRFQGGKPTVTDGPFAETKEVVGGFWMIRAASRQAALDWAARVPAADGDIIEVRQVFEMSDFPEDVRRAAENPVVLEALDANR